PQAGIQLSGVMRSIAPDVPVYDVKSLAQRRHDEEASVRLNTYMLIFFASSALVLAIIGIYSILVYTVRQQSFEIGIRMALGADLREILRHFTWKGIALLGIGMLSGLASAPPSAVRRQPSRSSGPWTAKVCAERKSVTLPA
ncbi:MAG TPA: FtsX-like permease family protein, partial [Thermoanaerobaculia bacterium]|nr:FtsX-like permease family protein [Thermoanaerobaculia bacterium]